MKHISKRTKKEGPALWDLIIGIGIKPFAGSAYHFDKTDDTPERVVFMSGVERMCIQFDGKVWADSDLIKIELNQNTITEYFDRIGIVNQ